MTLRLCVAFAMSLATTGCVAAIPLATQALSGSGLVSQLCSVATIPGQTTSLCDQARVTAAVSPQGGAVTAPAATTYR